MRNPSDGVADDGISKSYDIVTPRKPERFRELDTMNTSTFKDIERSLS